MKQQLIRLQILSKSLTGEQIASEFINVIPVTYGIHSKYLLGAMRVRASTNNLAMRILKVVYLSLIDIVCFPQKKALLQIELAAMVNFEARARTKMTPGHIATQILMVFTPHAQCERG